MAKVIDGTMAKRETQAVTILKTGHPAVFRKMRCTACSVGYAVKSNTTGAYVCGRCGAAVKIQTM